MTLMTNEAPFGRGRGDLSMLYTINNFWPEYRVSPFGWFVSLNFMADFPRISCLNVNVLYPVNFSPEYPVSLYFFLAKYLIPITPE